MRLHCGGRAIRAAGCGLAAFAVALGASVALGVATAAKDTTRTIDIHSAWRGRRKWAC